MENQVLKQKEEIRLLKLLLNEEQIIREKLAADFHGKKNGLVRLIHNCQQFAKDRETESAYFDFASHQIKNISEVLEELGKVEFHIYPKAIHWSGVAVGIRQFVNVCKEKYAIDIIIFDVLDEEIKLSRSKEIGIYKTSMELISYLCNSSVNSVQIEMYYDNENFVFDISAKRTDILEKTPELEKQIELIRGLLVWQDASVVEATNWTDRITVEFKIN